MQLSTILIFVVLFFTISTNEATFPDCNRTFSCGELHNISYPFTGGERPEYCGLPEFRLSCNNNIPEIFISSISYRVLELDQTMKTMTLSRSDLYKSPCLHNFTSTTLDNRTLILDPNNRELTLLYGCSDDDSNEYSTFPCGNANLSNGYYIDDALDDQLDDMKCHAIVKVPVLESAAIKIAATPALLGGALKEGFSVKYEDPFDGSCKECASGSGRNYCGMGLGRFVCICGDKICPTPGKSSTKVPVVVGSAVGGTAAVAILVGFFSFLLKRRKQAAAMLQSKELPTPPSSQGLPPPTTKTYYSQRSSYTSMSSDLENGSMYFGAQVFSYTELEEATNCFDPSRELGDGGFGTVYYGLLKDGRSIAVKRLYENNWKRVEQFMNEVEILTRLKHLNLVQLYGCTSRRSRELILVYEYISNGTVADHLHGKQAKSAMLTWHLRLSIAIESAAALAYLHSSDIIHRDVKTTNILLDNNFTVKVADFGLSRLFPTDVTHVSTAPQGTPGYVDPEYYQCYQLTSKSDVYSFGVVLIELISSKPPVDITRHRLDINLANMAMNRIQNHAVHELFDTSLGFETDFSMQRAMKSVAELAFRCLQQDKDMRPCMEEVLAVLKGIQREEVNTGKVEVIDIKEDDVRLLKSDPFPLSPDSVTNKWVSGSTTTYSSSS